MTKSKKIGRPKLMGPRYYCNICDTSVPCNSWHRHIRDVHDYPHGVKPGCQPYDPNPQTPAKILGGDLSKTEKAAQDQTIETQITGEMLQKLSRTLIPGEKRSPDCSRRPRIGKPMPSPTGPKSPSPKGTKTMLKLLRMKANSRKFIKSPNVVKKQLKLHMTPKSKGTEKKEESKEESKDIEIAWVHQAVGQQ